MQARHMDHVNFRIPEDRVDEAIAFYQDALGFDVEGLEAYREGERPIFGFRLGEASVMHVLPVDDFEEASGRNFDHVAIVLETTIEECKATLADAGIEVERESTPLGATGTNPAVYVRDPFGYLLELKEAQ